MLNEITKKFDGYAQKRAVIEAELAALFAQEMTEKANLRMEAVVEAQALLDHFEIAPDEMTFRAKRTLKPRYRNPETGETWHGYGRRAAWLKNKNLDDYRIDGSETSVGV